MKAVIFDFDGTIADTFPFVFEIATRLAPKYGFEPPTRGEVENLRNFSLSQLVRRYKIKPVTLFRMLLDAHRANKNRLNQIQLFPGVPDVVRELSKKGYQLAIISSNSEKNIKILLKKNGLGGVIQRIHTSMQLFGKGKMLRKMMRKAHFTPSETIYVGDELRDIDAAQEAGVKVISVSWGYNTKEALEKHNQLIVDKPGELPGIIESLFN